MLKLIATFPVLTRELSKSLRNEGRETLAEQIDAALITRITFDEAAMLGTSMLNLRERGTSSKQTLSA